MKVAKKYLFLLALFSGSCWGTYGTFANLMVKYGVEIETVSLICPLVEFLLFLTLLFLDDIRKIRAPKKLVPAILFYGLLGATFSYAIVQAYSRLPIGIVSTIVFCNLFLIMGLSYFLFHDPLTWQKGLAAVLAVLGIALVLNIFELQWSLSAAGLLWSLLAMVVWGSMVTMAKYFMFQGVDGNAVMTYSGFFSVLFISILSPPWQSLGSFAGAVATSKGMVLLPVLGLTIITTLGCYSSYLYVLKRLEAAYVQLGFIMDPVMSSILGIVFFGQKLQAIQISGILLIVLVVSWVQWCESRAGIKSLAHE